MIENTGGLLRAKRLQISKWILYSSAGFLFIISFSLVYLIPSILRLQKVDECFLLFSKDYSVTFFYKNDELVNAVVAMYFIFVYPYIAVFFVLVIILVMYKINRMKNCFNILKYKDDFLLFLGNLGLLLLCVFVTYFVESGEPVALMYQAYFKNRIFFSIFLFGVQAWMIFLFSSMFFFLIDTFVYNQEDL